MPRSRQRVQPSAQQTDSPQDDMLDDSSALIEQEELVRRRWWQRPQLRTDEEEHRERRVTWLELFYDLVFVVVIAEVAHYLAEHVSLGGVLGYMLLFLPVWWVWIGGTYYTERFETPDLSHRILTFLQMLPVAALAVFAHDGLGATSTGYALAYAAARALITFMWWRAGWHNPRARPMTNRFVAGFSLSVLLFVVSVFVSPPWRFVLWGIALFIDLFTPSTTLHVQARLPRFSTSRLPERYGLFMIIVLGEAIVGVVGGVAEQEPLTLRGGLTGALGMALVFSLWWVYFDYVARRPPRSGNWWSSAWSYLHLPLVMAIAALGAAVLNVLAADSPTLPANVRLLLCGAVAVALIVIGVLEMMLRPDPEEPTTLHTSVTLKVAAGVLVLALAVWGSSLGALALLGLLLVLVLTQIVHVTYVSFQSRPARMLEPRSVLEAADETTKV